MKKLHCSLLVSTLTASFAIASCLSRPVDADDPKQTPAMSSDQVTQEYSQINDAVMKRDLDKIMSFLADDFTEVDSAGATVDRKQERKNYQARFDQIKSMNCHFDVHTVTPTPDGASCDVTIHMDGIGVKRIMFMKLQAPFTNELIVHDLWVQTPSGWKIKSRLTLKDQTTINPA